MPFDSKYSTTIKIKEAQAAAQVKHMGTTAYIIIKQVCNKKKQHDHKSYKTLKPDRLQKMRSGQP